MTKLWVVTWEIKGGDGTRLVAVYDNETAQLDRVNELRAGGWAINVQGRETILLSS